jgi:GT2 family glycosyltransferase
MPQNRFADKDPALCQRIFAVTVTYNVSKSFAHHIKTYLHQVEKVILVDNSTEAISRAIVRTIADSLSPKVSLIANETNFGLARAQNIGIRQALMEGAEWVLLMDDDSAAVSGMINGLKEGLAATAHPEKVGILAPVIQDRNTGKPQPFMSRWGGCLFRRRGVGEDHTLEDVMAVIAAGSLIRREVLEEIGLMREDFYIDYIDTEFCLRARSRHWHILAAGSARLSHTIGAKTAHRLLKRTFHTSNHTAPRRFTIYRNRSCMWKGYWYKVPGYVLYDLLAVPYDMFRIACFEKGRKAKFKSIGRGLKHGLFKMPARPKDGFPSVR